LVAKVASGSLASSPVFPSEVEDIVHLGTSPEGAETAGNKLAGTSRAKKGAIHKSVAVLKGLEDDRVTKVPLGEVKASALPQQVRTPSAYSLSERIEQAKQSGYDEGYKKGFDDALSSIEADRLDATRKLVEVLGNSVSLLAESRHEVMAASSSEVVDLACRIAEAILLRELTVSKNPGREALERALNIVPGGSDLVVHMHPDDIAELGDLREWSGEGRLGVDSLGAGVGSLGVDNPGEGILGGGLLKGSLLDGGNLEIVPDSSVERGGCVVQVGSCRIDAQWSAALQRVTDLLHSSLPETDVSLDPRYSSPPNITDLHSSLPETDVSLDPRYSSPPNITDLHSSLPETDVSLDSRYSSPPNITDLHSSLPETDVSLDRLKEGGESVDHLEGGRS
jgi:flagellar assembly protein FliH